MARFGQGVNYQLGMRDYSPILQGAQMAAQGQMQGAQAIAQGLANLGQSMGNAVKQRQEYKAQIKAGDNAIKAISSLQGIPPEIKAMAEQASARLKDPNLSLVDQAKIGAEVNQLFGGVMQMGIQGMMQKQEAERARIDTLKQWGQQADAIAAGGANPNIVNFVRNFGPQATGVLAQAQKDITPAAQEGAIVSEQDILDARNRGFDLDAVPLGGGKFLAKKASGVTNIPKPYRSPEEEAQASAMAAEAKAKAETAVKFMEDVRTTGKAASDSLDKQIALRSLLESPDTQTGAAQDWVTNSRAFAKRFLGVKDDQLANQQLLETAIAEDQFTSTKNLLQGQGAVSNYERQSVMEAGMKATKDKGALLDLLAWKEAASARSIAASQHIDELEASGKSAAEIRRAMNKWYDENRLSAFKPAPAPVLNVSKANSIIKGS